MSNLTPTEFKAEKTVIDNRSTCCVTQICKTMNTLVLSFVTTTLLPYFSRRCSPENYITLNELFLKLEDNKQTFIIEEMNFHIYHSLALILPLLSILHCPSDDQRKNSLNSKKVSLFLFNNY